MPAGEGAAAWKRGWHGGRIALVAAGRGGAARRQDGGGSSCRRATRR